MVKLDLAELSQLPQGTVGKEYSLFMRNHCLDPHFLPPKCIKTERGWFLNHLRVTHDLMHLVSGYDPHFGEELSFQAFYSANMKSSFSMICVSQCLNYVAKNHSQALEFHSANASEAFLRGSVSEMLSSVDWQNSLGMQLCELRRELKIPERKSEKSLLKG